jgi:DNA invertase Pin-like site-specific DNA recombinase
MSPKKSQPAVTRNVAVGYVRLSYCRKGEDSASPERQEANIRDICQRYGWIPEIKYNVDGHHSGTSEEKRPGWLEVKTRLLDPDVVALVGNDLSRLHRNMGNQSSLNQLLKKLGLKLVLAATNEVIDFSGEGQTVQFLSTNIRGLMHEVYAWEVSEKQHLSIKYWRNLGKHIGNPPFGAARNKDGYLMPSPDGAWLLSNGTFVAGTPDNPPEPDALWKSYYEAAKRVMTLYVEKNRGVMLSLQKWHQKHGLLKINTVIHAHLSGMIFGGFSTPGVNMGV